MSDPFVRKFNWLRFLLLGSAVGATIFIGTIFLGAVAINFANYQETGGLQNGDTQLAQVSIGNLWNGIQLSAGESLMVKATAVGPKTFLSMELWVDGQLAGVQAAPSGGAHPFSTFFYWLPNEPGNHALVAAAIDSDGNRILSSQVVVIISPDPSAGAISPPDPDIAPVVLPAPGGGAYIPPSPPDSNDSVDSAEEWRGSPGNWINSITANEYPVAPELVANAEGCGVELLIHDHSSNEVGFLVFKEDSYSPDWIQVAALSANSQSEWISFSDGGLPGTATYYVTSFNSQGQANSNLATVNINQADCPSELGKTPGYTLEVTKLFPELPSEMNYCYVSTDGVNWARWPQLGFLTPDQDGIITGGPVLLVQSQGIDGEDITPRLGLNMECWGWQNEALVQLGDFFIEGEAMDPEFFDPYFVGDPGLQAEVIFEAVEFVGQPSYPEMTGSIEAGQVDQPELLGGSDFDPEENQHPLKTSISPMIPHVWLDWTLDINECMKHLPPHSQNSQEAPTYCFVYPDFDPSQRTGVVQPYLIWGFSSPSTCLDGSGDDCFSYVELQALAKQSGGVVGFDVTSISNAGLFSWPITEENLTMMVMPPLSCTGNADYSVRMWYKPGSKGAPVDTAGPGAQADVEGSDFSQENQAVVQDDAISSGDQPEIPFESSDYSTDGGPHPTMGDVYYSMLSNLVSLPCELITNPVQFLDVTFKILDVYNIDDGDDDDTFTDLPYLEDIEVYGYFEVVSPSMGVDLLGEPCSLGSCDPDPLTTYDLKYLNIATWETGSDDCDSGASDSCLKTFGAKMPVDLTAISMCQSSKRRDCVSSGTPTEFQINNNTLRVYVKYGDALGLGIKLIDYDENSDNDLVCERTVFTPSKTLDEWANTHNAKHTVTTPATDSGQCTIEVIINAVNP